MSTKIIYDESIDIEMIKHKPDMQYWTKTKASDNTGELSDFVPKNILYFNQFVEKVFTSEKPMEYISANKSFLADIRGTRWQTSTGGGKGTNNFSSLFADG